MQDLPTVTIDRDGEPVIINESDYCADSMKLYGQKPKAKAAPKKTRKPKAES